MTAPIKVEIALDLDRHLAAYRGMNAYGDAIEAPTTLEEVVFGEAARQIVTQVMGQTKRDVAYGTLWDRVTAIRDEELRARIVPLIEEAIGSAIQRTNRYGEASGEPLTLRQVIVDTAEKYLKEPTGDNYRNPKRLNPVQTFIQTEVASAFAKELAGAVAAAKAEVIAAVQAEGGRVLAQTIAAMAKS